MAYMAIGFTNQCQHQTVLCQHIARGMPVVKVGRFKAEFGDKTRFRSYCFIAQPQIAADRAFEQAGVDRADVGVAEVHDCFTVTEMLMMEALGFAGRGEAKEMVRNGDLDIDGRLPCNTGGGLVGFGHPVGATGVKQVLEVYRQMKGQCGDYQMATKPEYGVTANMGGDDKTAVVSVLKNCA